MSLQIKSPEFNDYKIMTLKLNIPTPSGGKIINYDKFYDNVDNS